AAAWAGSLLPPSALREAARLPLRAMAELDIACGFDDLGRVHAALAAVAAEKASETFEATGVRLRVRLPADQACVLKNQLRDATRDRVRCTAAPGPAPAWTGPTL
ncbi:MAG TPA: DUF1949 domain-containing protein, partial [Rhodanobacter sp.]